MITQHGWMFLSSYEKMRQDLLQDMTIDNLVHLGARAFEEISGEVVQTVSFVCRKEVNASYNSTYIRLVNAESGQQKEKVFLQHLTENEFSMPAETIKKIPGNLFAYWLSDNFIYHLVKGKKVGEYGAAKQGLITSDNERFLRFWFEISNKKINEKWFLYNKGGGFRRWYGNLIYVVNWQDNGYEICHFTDKKGKLKSRPQNIQFFFSKGLTWNDVSTAKFCCRYVDGSCAFDASGPTLFMYDQSNLFYFLGLLNSSMVQEFMNLICQGLHYSTGHVPQIPVCIADVEKVADIARENVDICKEDWDNYETSIDFRRHPLV